MGSRFVDLADVPRGVRIPHTWWSLCGVSKISLRRVAHVLECTPSRIRMRRNHRRKRNQEGLATVRCCEISENSLTAHVHAASGKTVRVCQTTGLAHAIVSHLGSTANPTRVRNLRSGLQPRESCDGRVDPILTQSPPIPLTESSQTLRSSGSFTGYIPNFRFRTLRARPVPAGKFDRW